MGLNSRLAVASIAVLASGLAACGGRQTAAAQAAAAPAAGVQVAAVTGQSDPNDPLIGQWRFTGIGNGPASATSACSTAMTFTAADWVQTHVDGTTTTDPVTYIPSAKVVYVVDVNGDHTTYVLVDQDHIALDSFAPCAYARAG
jgi:hypothetical protein